VQRLPVAYQLAVCHWPEHWRGLLVLPGLHRLADHLRVQQLARYRLGHHHHRPRRVQRSGNESA
jgi:hypothetical protein